MAVGRGHLLIGGAQFFVIVRPAAYFRELSIHRAADVFPAVPVVFLRFAISGLFGIVVIGAGGAIDRHPDLLLLPALTVHLATARPKTSCALTRAYAEAVRQK